MKPYPEPSVVGIWIADARGAPMRAVDSANLLAGRGIEGDRHCATPAQAAQKARVVTLIEEEAIAGAQLDTGLSLGAADTRRNIVVRGVALNHLVGRWFRIGGVLLEGKELCEPCGHLAKLTSPAWSKALVHRGGLRAWVREGGTVKPGDAIAHEDA